MVESVGEFKLSFNQEILPPLQDRSVFSYKDIFIFSVKSALDGSVAYGKIDKVGFDKKKKTKRDLSKFADTLDEDDYEETTQASKLNFNVQVRITNASEIKFTIEWQHPMQVS